MFNDVHFAIHHKDRFALEHAKIHSPNSTNCQHLLIGVALIDPQSKHMVHKTVHSQDLDFWCQWATQHPGYSMSFPSSLPSAVLNHWRDHCARHNMGFSVYEHAFTSEEEHKAQLLIQPQRPRKMAA